MGDESGSSLSSSTSSSGSSSLTWSAVSSGPWSRRRKHQAVVWKGNVLLLGGFDGEKAFDLNDVWSWDGKSSNWTEICKKAEWSGRDGHCAIVYNEAIYLLGGTDDPYNCRSDIWRSDDGGNHWRQVLTYAPWPERWQHAACVHDGKMYVLGGWGDNYLNDVWCSSNGVDWQQVCTSAPWRARMFLSAVSFNDAIYVIGGHDGRQQLRDVWASSDGGATWTQVCQTAQWEARQGHACVVLNDQVYIMGGFGGSTRFNDLWKSSDCAHWTLVSRNNSWSPRQGHASVVAGGAIYILGGFDAAGYCNDMHSLALEEVSSTANEETRVSGVNQRIATRRSPKTVTVSLLCALESIAELRVNRSNRDCLLRTVEDMLSMVHSATHMHEVLTVEADDTTVQATLFESSANDTSASMSASLVTESAFEKAPRDAFMKSMSASQSSHSSTSKSSATNVSSLDLRRLMEEGSRKLTQLQRDIRSAAERNESGLVETLISQREALAKVQFDYSIQLMRHVNTVRRMQDRQQTHLSRVLTRIESFHLIGGGASYFLTSNSGDSNDGLLPDEGSQCTLEEWDQILRQYEEVACAISPVESDLSVSSLAHAMAQQAKTASRVAEWVSNGTSTEGGAEVFELGLSPSLPVSPLSPGSPISSEITPPLASSSSLSPTMQTPAIRERTTSSVYTHSNVNFEKLSDEFQDAEEEAEKCRMAVKTNVDTELALIAAHEASVKSLLRTSMEKGCGLVKSMITQNRMAVMEQSAEEEQILGWQFVAVCLLQTAALKERCDVLVAVNAKKEDELLRLEGDRIDRRSLLEKALLQGSRRIQRGPSRLGAGLEATASTDSFDRDGSDIDELKASLAAAERAVKEARRAMRAWYRDVRKLAIDLTPELFSLIPDLQSPGSVLGDGGFADYAKVPHRLLDDYENISMLNSGDDASSASESKAPGGRHVLLKATYDGEEVVLKGFVMHDGDQRRGLERELSILGRLRNDSIICPGAIVEGTSSIDGVVKAGLQVAVFIEYPFCRGGNLSSWLKSERKPWELQGVARQLLYGLMYLHDHGVIHKDIKPSNVLLHEDGRVVLADFELSREVRNGGGGELDEISTTSRSGTRGFMSPEVEADGHAMYASDMYSFGVLLYFMHFPTAVAGLVPGDPRIPANNDAELTDLIQRLLAISPSARPTAASALMHPYFRSTFVERLMQDGEVVEQDRKLDAVRNLLYRARSENRANLEKIVVHRDRLVSEVLHYFQEMPLERMKASLRVTFGGEPGIDEGGLLTEMFTIFFDGVLQGDVEGGLFEGADTAARREVRGLKKEGSSGDVADKSDGDGDGDNGPKFINSVVLPAAVEMTSERVLQLRAFGRAMVKALYEGRRIGSRLCPSVFKFLTGATSNMRDLQMYDPQTARSLQWTLATAGVEDFGLHFESVGAPELGPVTDVNKATFVGRKIQSIMVGKREPYLLAIKAGFVEALRALSEEAAPFMSLLSHTDWRVMLCGDPAVSGQQVLSTMRFSGFNKKSNVPQWLKDIVLSFSEDYLRKFLVFITGCPSLTSSSGANKIEINVRCQARSGALPVAHTCFFHLDVPDYRDKETLQAKLMYAITNAQGFEVV